MDICIIGYAFIAAATCTIFQHTGERSLVARVGIYSRRPEMVQILQFSPGAYVVKMGSREHEC